jgi:sigma-E factor negative regulatory protein RseC
MPTEKGIIEKTDNEKAFVRVQKNSACAHCESRGMCQIDNEKEMVVEVENNLGGGPGDQVEIMVPTGSFIKISLMVYMLPVLAFMFGAFMGDNLAGKLSLNPSLAAILGGTGLMVILFYLLKRLDKVIGSKKRYRPRLTRIISNSKKINSEAAEV